MGFNLTDMQIGLKESDSEFPFYPRLLIGRILEIASFGLY